jgi:hypothetical protein
VFVVVYGATKGEKKSAKSFAFPTISDLSKKHGKTQTEFSLLDVRRIGFYDRKGGRKRIKTIYKIMLHERV